MIYFLQMKNRYLSANVLKILCCVEYAFQLYFRMLKEDINVHVDVDNCLCDFR